LGKKLQGARASVLVGAVCLAWVAAACTPPPPAPPPDRLVDEHFVQWDPASITSGTCDPAGSSTFTFTVSGDATGPYPGTFTESGSVTIGPQTEEFLPGQFRGDITAFTATFDITSTAGNVHGTTALNTSASFLKGVCGGLSAQVVVSTTNTGKVGSASTAGTGHSSFNMYPGTCGCPGSSPDFHEDFT
jgi:hypothetical protein